MNPERTAPFVYGKAAGGTLLQFWRVDAGGRQFRSNYALKGPPIGNQFSNWLVFR
jgi:hypothetical protein